jgi:cation diffusion facilitator CzcD-associated flavoprotein CzcO
VTTNGAAATEHVDVLIVGAGLSGVGAACHMRRKLPGKSFTILEARDDMGGTWDLFRYPGIRSDSDMFTLGYSFRPWTEAEAIADGPAIWRYIHETARDYGVDERIRFGHRVVCAEWSTPDARWTVHAERGTGELATLTCDFLFACTGYYRYDEGYTPDFAGMDRFRGEIVHPQFWPEGLDYEGKSVLVIGSGATAVTLVPAMADAAAHVTMLQRSPSYVLAIPSADPLANALRRVLGARRAYPIVRWKNVTLATLLYQLSQRRPKLMRSLLRRGAIKQLPEGYAVDTHFNPTYGPWDQRLCLVPDGDLFRTLKAGRASIVTDRIERFTETGVLLESAAALDADIVVTATGLNLLAIGGIELSVDGAPVSLPERMAYKGMMLSRVPNFAFTIGYTNASWTLKADLVAEFVCRLLAYMEDNGYRQCMPVDDDPSVEPRPLLDFSAGYVQRSLHLFPKGGSRAPWRLGMSYANDVVTIRHGALEDGALRFSAP